MGMPNAFTSWERATMSAVIIERTTTDLSLNLGVKTRSQET